MNILTPRQKLQRIRAMADELREMFVGANPSIATDQTGVVRLGLHQCRSYEYATDTMRGLGFGKREKQTMPDGATGKTAILGRDSIENIVATAYCNELPPTCRLETYEVKVKKVKKTVEGEVTVKRQRIVCDVPLD